MQVIETIRIPAFDAIVTAIPGQKSPLTKHELALYWALRAANGRTVSQETLYDILYGSLPESDQPDYMDIVKVFICKLRKKVPGIKIKTVWAVGYAMEVE